MSRSADAWAAVRGRPRRFLTSAWPWRAIAYVASTVPVGLVTLAVLFLLVGAGLLGLIVLVGVLLLMQVPVVARVVAAGERRRLGLLQREPAPGHRASLREQLRAARGLPVAWGEVGYAVLLATALLAVDLLGLVLLAVPVVFLITPLLWHLGSGPVESVGWTVDSTAESWLAVPVGLVLAVPVLYALTWLACGQAALARLLLDPPGERLLEAVAELRRTRSGLVDAFEAERHRIERDLHDGVQQRLVALVMTLGTAELELERGSAGLALVEQAHRQAEDALVDLRATVRGIHPRVLTERGLAAAVHEIADRSPVPVVVELVLPRRLPPPVENAAYFVVSEALTNVARHARASRAEVHGWIDQSGRVQELVLTVSDDGVGGADPDGGSGLKGLAARAEALDGALTLTSPEGGPTRVQLRCPL